MSSVVISGDTSGTVTLTVPTAAGTNTATLPAATGTIVVAGANSAITSGTAQASTSGTSIDFTGIPSWVKRITVMFNGVSTNGASTVQVQLGSGSITTTGYLSGSSGLTASALGTTFITSGLQINNGSSAAYTHTGSMILSLLSANNWVEQGSVQLAPNAMAVFSGGVSLGGTLDRIRITTVNGTDTFDAGSINILYEQEQKMAYGTVNADVIGTSVAGSNLGAGNASLMKNRIINGAMVIDQRNAGASVTPTASTYTLDRWQYQQSVSSKFSIQQNAGSVTPPVGFSNYLGATSLSAYSALVGDFFVIGQYVEGFNTADLAWGTANAKTVTLSFQVYSSLTGTFGGSIRNFAANRSYPFTYSIPVANTWTSISVTIAGDTTGTWVGATNGTGLEVFFGMGVGSTYSGTAGSWASANYISATGATSVVGTSGATFYITGVQLEVGSSATGFEYRQYQQELALCQRYYEPQLTRNVTANTGLTVYCFWQFMVQKRAIPTIGVGGGSAWTTVDSNGLSGLLVYITSGNAVIQNCTASSEL